MGAPRRASRSAISATPRPKSTVGTPAYIAPEVLSRREYDGKRIMSVQYKIPDYAHISQDCKQLISRIFVANPMKVMHNECLCTMQRITIREIKSHPWFLKNLPRELTQTAQTLYYRRDNNAPTYSAQRVDEIMNILTEAQKHRKLSRPVPGCTEDESEEEEAKEENKNEGEKEEDDEYDKTVKAVHGW
ncbi:hypothetical protein BHM03_00026348 [Ensete ventricosum]|nr:hypothetical protein BHM03_00026348 [Ensete ventricosum]